MVMPVLLHSSCSCCSRQLRNLVLLPGSGALLVPGGCCCCCKGKLVTVVAGAYVRKQKKNPLAEAVAAAAPVARLLGERGEGLSSVVVSCSEFLRSCSSSSCRRFHATQQQQQQEEEEEEEKMRMANGTTTTTTARRRTRPLPLLLASRCNLAEAEGGGELAPVLAGGRSLTRDGRLLFFTPRRLFSTRKQQIVNSRDLRLPPPPPSSSSSRQAFGAARIAAAPHQANTYLTEDEDEDEEEEDQEEDFASAAAIAAAEEEDDGCEEDVVRKKKSSKRDGRRNSSSRVYTLARPRLLAPVRDLITEAVERGYAKKNAIGLARATSQPKYSAAEDRAIVDHFSAIIRGIVEYYAFVNKRSSLWKVTSIYRKSCALTLARKHSMRSAAAAFNRFGPYLRISEHGKEVTSLYYPTSLKTSGKFNTTDPRYCEVSVLHKPFQRSIRRILEMAEE